MFNSIFAQEMSIGFISEFVVKFICMRQIAFQIATDLIVIIDGPALINFNTRQSEKH